jgi:hypothetical protein
VAKCALYRHFDAAGNLLYVGIAYNPFRRTGNHSFNADWYQSVCRIEIEWHATREKALWLEELAIARENPRHNSMRPAGVGEDVQPQRKGIRSRKPEVQEQIDAIIEEAAGSTANLLRRSRCPAAWPFRMRTR